MRAGDATGSFELRPGFRPRPGISHAVLDFDGTLSLIRGGWMRVMLDLFCELCPAAPGEDADALRALLLDDIAARTGLPTAVQMDRFAARVRERGGDARPPSWYHGRYQALLQERIRARIAEVERGGAVDALMVHGARALLDLLRARGWTLHLLSGTEEEDVVREVDLLGIGGYFVQVVGARSDRSTDKGLVIDRILRTHGVDGHELLIIGDGQVEIVECKRVGGLALAVASDEDAHGSGRVDPWKRRRLLDSGADAVVPDYRDADAVLAALTGEA